jgi:hypothetical protein
MQGLELVFDLLFLFRFLRLTGVFPSQIGGTRRSLVVGECTCAMHDRSSIGSQRLAGLDHCMSCQVSLYANAL